MGERTRRMSAQDGAFGPAFRVDETGDPEARRRLWIVGRGDAGEL